MRITRIYHEGDIRTGDELALDHVASGHLVRVLRLKAGAPLCLFNGRGGEYTANLLNADPKAAHVRVESFSASDNDSPLYITLLQGISRGDHMDVTVQKATELGVQNIIPVICERTQGIKTDKLEKKLQRWRKIAISASEQCGRTSLPRISEAVSISDLLSYPLPELKLVLDPAADSGLTTVETRPGETALLTGPEGGLSEHEIARARAHGFKGIRFGPRILRTETAGPAFIAAIQAVWGDMG